MYWSLQLNDIRPINIIQFVVIFPELLCGVGGVGVGKGLPNKWIAKAKYIAPQQPPFPTWACTPFTFSSQMCLALRYFATGANFSTIAETQQVSSATVSRCVSHIARYFYYFHHRYMH